MGKPQQKSKAGPSSKFSKARKKGVSAGVKGVSGKSKKTFKKPAKKRVFSSSKKKESGKISGVKRASATADEVEQKPDAKRPKSTDSTAPKKASSKPVKKVSSSAARKERLVHRKQQRKDFELVKESKVIWEYLRPHKPSPGKSLAKEELVALAQGHFKELVLKHDTARVVQSLLKNGSPQERDVVFSELKDSIVELSKLKYSKFVVKALLKYCPPSARAEIISSLYGHVRKLIRHAEAAEIVELTYNDYANLQQRTALIQEFYGAEFALFKDVSAEEHTSAQQSQSLEDILSTHPTKRRVILNHMKDCLVPLLNKGVVRHSIVHRALLDYLQHCTPQARSEMIECLREKVVNILHTKDGSRVAMQCVWHGSVKDRKIIVKSLKGLVCKVCQEENGHLLMLAIFDSVDDTVLVKKVLLSELGDHLQELCANQYARRVVLYLLAPRSSRHFSSQFTALLSPGDGNAHTKKPVETRHKELLEGVANQLIGVASENAVEWTLTSQYAPVLLEIATALASYDLSPLYEPLLQRLSEPEEGEEDLVQHPCGHWVIKKLIAVKEGKGFVEQLLDRADLCGWALGSNRGAFVVCAVAEVVLRPVGETSEEHQKLLEILEPAMDKLRHSGSELKGQSALYDRLCEHIQ